VTIPTSFSGVTCTSGNSSHVVINSTNTSQEFPYYLEGSSSNGSLTINGEYKLSVILGGVNLTSGKGAAIDIECGKRIDFILPEGTTNTLSDYAGGTQKAALYTKGHAEFKGAGTLNVTGNVKHAIAAKEYIELKGSLGTINVLGAKSDGIHCGKGEKGNTEDNIFRMNGGTVNISNCGSDCIDSDDYGNVKIERYSMVKSIESLKQALLLNGPCIGGMYVKDNNKTEFWIGNQNNGGHAIAIVGYDKKGFIIRNSWGKNYGNRGYATLKYEDFHCLLECWTIVD
jgi:hypothetical protein